MEEKCFVKSSFYKMGKEMNPSAPKSDANLADAFEKWEETMRHVEQVQWEIRIVTESDQVNNESQGGPCVHKLESSSSQAQENILIDM